MTDQKIRAPRNRTVSVADFERTSLRARLVPADQALANNFLDRTIHGDSYDVIPRLPARMADLIILDPPYNLNKKFGDRSFSRRTVEEYSDWLRGVLRPLARLLKSTATVYICGDWHSSTSIYGAASEFLMVRNRITWEREKGRGALSNWKNASEDIWYCTVSDDYTFNVDAVKLRRKVIAPYRTAGGAPKDWMETSTGNFRDTHPSNLWTDITIPFWSMPENTDHPTQKSEKLIAKLILASSRPGDLVLDPFLGSGTTSVVARKLGRRFCGIEIDEEYALLAEKRLAQATLDVTIQGYSDNLFWERNTLSVQSQSVQSQGAGTKKRSRPRKKLPSEELEMCLPLGQAAE
jgi:site-specific DNA-methyltransferase (adenine-specific)